MPPAVIAAGVGAAGSLLGGVLQNRAQGKATDAQSAATAEALAFQREQAAKAEEAYKQRYLESQAMRKALLDRYGVEVPGLGEAGAMPPGGGGPPGAMPRAAMGGGPGGMPPNMAQRGGPPAGGVPPRAGLTLGEMAQRPFYDWNSFQPGRRG